MGIFFQRGWRLGCGVLSAVALVGLCGSAGASGGGKPSAWDAAVAARQVFEAESAGTHTRAEYAGVMDGFRAIYHADPGDAHAARAIEQVAELLAEQGREFGEKKSLRDAVGQYEFLAKGYPGGTVAASALAKAAELLGPDGVGDEAEAAKVKAQLALAYPRYARVVAAREVGPVKVAGDSPTSQMRDVAHPDSAASGKVGLAKLVAAPVDAGVMATVTGIRHWSTASYTRVAIDLAVEGGGDVTYEAARVENPDRIFFDLHHAKLGQGLVGKSFAVTDDGFLTKVRAAQFSDDVTRVVLDVHEVAEYSAFLLPNPYRLIIDIHGKQGISEKREAIRGASAGDEVVAAAPEVVAPVVAAPVAKAGAVETSGLPPMPVTDGSAGFGLPPKKAAGVAGAARAEAAQPRVVISTKPTAAKPVPNTVTTHSAETGSEVAAVSSQQGKVEATNKPTSKPVSSLSSGSRKQEAGNSDGVAGDHYVPRSKRGGVAADVVAATPPISQSRDVGHPGHPADVAGVVPPTSQKRDVGHPAAPVEAAGPTADGETSLVRALGLKIGRIVIDAGHGGHDSGTLGAGGIEEKDVVLDVALRLGKLLHDRLGAEIVYTRADDTFIPLETRTAIANKAQADLFISVHANSSQDPSARGVEVYYLNFTSDPDAMKVASRENAVSTQSVHDLSDLVKKIALKDKIEESKELAGDVDASLYAGLRKGNEGLRDRGVKKAPFVVLIGANMPSILAEISFVTNPEDAAQLERPEYRERVAESLYGGVARYAGGINGGGAQSKRKVTERAATR